MNSERQADLIAAARRAREHAYAKYSNFRIGAAVRTISGAIFVGCNVENVSYGLTICAERVAICNAVAAGHLQFEAIAVASSGGVTPCGACRQFLAEFCEDLDLLLIDVDLDDATITTRLSTLLPNSFKF